jgi:hypothetical protein
MKHVILATIALTGVAFNAHAVQLAHEGFDYTAGQTFTGANGGSGFSSAWGLGGAATANVTPGSLSYPASVAYTPVGNSGTITTTGEFFAQSFRSLDATASLAAGTAGTRYISFLANSTNLQNYTQFGFGESVNTSVTFGFEDGQFTVEASGAGDKTLFGAPTAGTTYLFVGKIVNNGTQSVASLSAYAPGDTVPGTEGAYQATTNPFASVNLNRLYGFQGQNTALTVDEFRIGDTYADVVNVAPVPEPSTVAVLGLSALGLAARRRRA